MCWRNNRSFWCRRDYGYGFGCFLVNWVFRYYRGSDISLGGGRRYVRRRRLREANLGGFVSRRRKSERRILVVWRSKVRRYYGDDVEGRVKNIREGGRSIRFLGSRSEERDGRSVERIFIRN